MSKMIPLNIHESVKSNAERKVFDLFKNTPGTEDWVVLHSLALTSLNKKLYGEIDFLALIPNKGVFVLEVKGGRVKSEKGTWFFENKFGQITKKNEGPFEQVKNAAFSIIRDIKARLNENYTHLEHLFFTWGVMFPDIKFDIESVEFHNWQVYDLKTPSILHFINDLFIETQKKWFKIYNNTELYKLSKNDDVRYLTNLLRPEFDLKRPLNLQISEIENKLIKLTQEQYNRLTEIEDNPRILLNGSAGTGKTLLAIEAAKRFVNENLKVAFFCYNRNLADWINDYFDNKFTKLKPNIISTVHSKMIKDLTLSGKINPKYDTKKLFEDPSFYNALLPQLISQVIDFNDKYDVVIIDEAQDILFEGTINYIDKILVNGLFDGRWYFFGDFNNQTIYKDSNMDEITNQLNKFSFYTKLKLKTNCRNTIEIYETFKIYSQSELDDKTLGVRGVPVEFHFYETIDNKINLLSEKIKSLLQDGVSLSQITILSPYKFENSVSSKINYSLSKDFKEKNLIKFSTIYSYKGLENSVIILVDISSSTDEKLLYVAMSRAKSNLIVFADNDSKKLFDSKFKESIKNG